ncbi:MAG: ribonuclease H family protein [Candidatus Liptonbacteria bacterium]
MKDKKYYAYLIPKRGERGVCDNWAACEKKVKGVFGARYRGFKTRAEAEGWLRAGAEYAIKPKANLRRGIYFDAGTGRGKGVEISVTDERGKNLLHESLPAKKINKFGKHLVDGEATNNYGELLACKHALQIALARSEKKIFGDSRLIIDYWSKGYIKKEEVAPKTIRLAGQVKKLRKEFEAEGGSISHVPGGDNPADLGFHR